MNLGTGPAACLAHPIPSSFRMPHGTSREVVHEVVQTMHTVYCNLSQYLIILNTFAKLLYSSMVFYHHGNRHSLDSRRTLLLREGDSGARDSDAFILFSQSGVVYHLSSRLDGEVHHVQGSKLDVASQDQPKLIPDNLVMVPDAF